VGSVPTNVGPLSVGFAAIRVMHRPGPIGRARWLLEKGEFEHAQQSKPRTHHCIGRRCTHASRRRRRHRQGSGPAPEGHRPAVSAGRARGGVQGRPDQLTLAWSPSGSPVKERLRGGGGEGLRRLSRCPAGSGDCADPIGFVEGPEQVGLDRLGLRLGAGDVAGQDHQVHPAARHEPAGSEHDGARPPVARPEHG